MDDLHREQLSYIDSHKPSSPGSPHRHFSIRLTRADYVPRSPSPPLRSLSPNHGHVPLSPPLASPLRERSLSPTHGQLSRLQLDQYHGQPFSCHSRTIKREERLIVSSQGGRREVLERRTMYSDPVLQALLTSPTTLPHEKERHFEGKDQQRRRAGSPSLLQRTQPTQHRAHVSPTALRLAPPQSQQTLHRRAPSPTLLRHSLSPSKSSKSQTPRVLPISVQAQSQLPTMTRSSPPRPSTDYTVFPEFPQRAISYSVSKRDGFTEGAHKTNNDNSGPEFNDQNQNQNQVFGGLGWLQAARDALLSQYNASIDALGCSPAADAKPSDKGLLISRKFDNGPRRDSFSHSHFNRGGSCNAAYAPGTASIGLVVGRVDGAVVVNTLVDGYAASASNMLAVGDELVAIEGRDAKSLSIDEIHQLSLGSEGTYCKLVVQKPQAFDRGFSLTEVSLIREHNPGGSQASVHQGANGTIIAPPNDYLNSASAPVEAPQFGPGVCHKEPILEGLSPKPVIADFDSQTVVVSEPYASPTKDLAFAETNVGTRLSQSEHSTATR